MIDVICVYICNHEYKCTCHFSSHTLDFQDFSSGVCHVMKVTVAKHNPEMALLTQHSGVYCVVKITVAELNPEMALLTQHSGVYCVIKVTVAEHNPEMALLTQHTFCFSLDLLAPDGRVSGLSYGTCTFFLCVYIIHC